MPRKTKEQKELENKKESKTKSTKKVATSKKSTNTSSKKTTTKKTTVSKTKPATTIKNTSKKAATSKAKPATKSKATKTKTVPKKVTTKNSTKKTTTSKTKPVKSTKSIASSKKSTTAKKSTSTTKKTNTKLDAKKDSLLDSTLLVSEYYDLPYRYNKTVVKILAQTPSTLFVYWEISDEDIENYKQQYGENFFEVTKPVLIVYNKTLDYSFEIEINDFANSWYLKVNNSKCEYKIELGRRPIQYSENIKEDYIYVATSNDIEAPNDHILIEDFPNEIRFRNVKNNFEYSRKISELAISKNIRKIYDIYDLYKLIYQDENIDDIYDLSNPASGGNPSSGTFSSRFM